jgi:hypothetical protein
MPVPNVRKIMFLLPLPAPMDHSARAQASASFWIMTGTPKVFFSGVNTST